MVNGAYLALVFAEGGMELYMNLPAGSRLEHRCILQLNTKANHAGTTLPVRRCEASNGVNIMISNKVHMHVERTEIPYLGVGREEPSKPELSFYFCLARILILSGHNNTVSLNDRQHISQQDV